MIMKIICIIALIACLFIAYYSWTFHIHKPVEPDETISNKYKDYCPDPEEYSDPKKGVEKGKEWKKQLK